LDAAPPHLVLHLAGVEGPVGLVIAFDLKPAGAFAGEGEPCLVRLPQRRRLVVEREPTLRTSPRPPRWKGASDVRIASAGAVPARGKMT
jgi:hypothetical protein